LFSRFQAKHLAPSRRRRQQDADDSRYGTVLPPRVSNGGLSEVQAVARRIREEQERDASMTRVEGEVSFMVSELRNEIFELRVALEESELRIAFLESAEGQDERVQLLENRLAAAQAEGLAAVEAGEERWMEAAETLLQEREEERASHTKEVAELEGSITDLEELEADFVLRLSAAEGAAIAGAARVIKEKNERISWLEGQLHAMGERGSQAVETRDIMEEVQKAGVRTQPAVKRESERIRADSRVEVQESRPPEGRETTLALGEGEDRTSSMRAEALRQARKVLQGMSEGTAKEAAKSRVDEMALEHEASGREATNQGTVNPNPNHTVAHC